MANHVCISGLDVDVCEVVDLDFFADEVCLHYTPSLFPSPFAHPLEPRSVAVQVFRTQHKSWKARTRFITALGFPRA